MPNKNLGRAKFFKNNPHARAWAALDYATNQQKKITPGAIKVKKNQFAGKRAIILGAGVAGLTTAYELLAQESGMQVTVLEAKNRTGGRCLSLRTGDTLTEDVDSELFNSKPGETQVVRFKRPVGDSEPYLNAGPGRIPSSHKRLLSYLKQFGVAVEIYVMNTESNLVQIDGGPYHSNPVVYRRLDHNTRGWLSQMVYQQADELVKNQSLGIDSCNQEERAEQLKDLMISFGELTNTGEYVPTAGEDGMENARSRPGYDVLPGVDAGKIAEALNFDSLLASEFWDKTRFYQPVDFLWQSSLFQPVGGMDQVQHAFAQQVATLGGTLHLNSPVKSIDWDVARQEYVIQVSKMGTDECIEYRADYIFSNMAMPFLKNILSDYLKDSTDGQGFKNEFKSGLNAVYDAQFNPAKAPDADGFVARFLANTTKVGWQADRTLWQGSRITDIQDDSGPTKLSVPDSEVGVVPIFGGISWTDNDITQIWYPSTAYHDEKGVLTGAYNFSDIAYAWGKMPVNERLDKAREGAKLFGETFGDGLQDGVAIAWQNIPYIKGGWAQWHVVDNAVMHFNVIDQGTGVYNAANGQLSDPNFFIVGDQISSLPGWQEGAIASAMNAISRLTRPDMEIAHLAALPDTRIMVEGI
ncbi:MAG: NAD(P)-binding protein [Gammaproteobacteria bacterium]|nr:NAD(P)-binding protein [Gammaproteobacteria bacterium]